MGITSASARTPARIAIGIKESAKIKQGRKVKNKVDKEYIGILIMELKKKSVSQIIAWIQYTKSYKHP